MGGGTPLRPKVDILFALFNANKNPVRLSRGTTVFSTQTRTHLIAFSLSDSGDSDSQPFGNRIPFEYWNDTVFLPHCGGTKEGFCNRILRRQEDENGGGEALLALPHPSFR
ncbi:hypothetical protein NE237_031417 [Protea cynaroides]|uniref:Uncharacterized protein n=1 Tax=Protea cynaroides TaxID=273540 RepID=A0A9Q0R2J7_9MAGN|nr:hypothetical protein NE237_031417 [Protea cynaroides]